jgi:hypothetical protein
MKFLVAFVLDAERVLWVRPALCCWTQMANGGLSARSPSASWWCSSLTSGTSARGHRRARPHPCAPGDATGGRHHAKDAIGEAAFDAEQLHHVERLAIVGDAAWEQAFEKLARSFVEAETRFFRLGHKQDARRWLKRG